MQVNFVYNFSSRKNSTELRVQPTHRKSLLKPFVVRQENVQAPQEQDEAQFIAGDNALEAVQATEQVQFMTYKDQYFMHRFHVKTLELKEL